MAVRTCPVMQTRGTESIFASAIPVTRFVAPGPLVAIATPTFPVTRANPSAAKTAPCSCRVSTCRTPLPSSASYNGMIAPPGYPNTRSTPSARTHRKTISAPLSIYDLFGLCFRGFSGLRRLGRFLRVLAGQPAHHASQLRPHNLNRMLLLFLAQRSEVAPAVLVLLDPLPCERPILNVSQSLLHRRPRSIAYNFLAARQVAILRRIRNRMPHPAQPAFINQIDNQLHLVQTLKVRNLRSVSSLHQRLKPLLDQRRQPTAQHRLLAKQVAL